MHNTVSVAICIFTFLFASQAQVAAQSHSDSPPQINEPFVDPTAELGEPAAQKHPETTGAGWDDLKIRFGGMFQSDLRFRLNAKSNGMFFDLSDSSYYLRDDLPSGISRNENILKLKIQAVYGSFAAVVDSDLVWLGLVQDSFRIEELSSPQNVNPYYWQTHALYLEATDLLVDGLDLRIGQQLVQWGKADQFNPTNNLNASDLEDVLLFGQQQANMMVRLDYYPWSSLELNAVLVPIFRPALVPRTAPLALAAVDRLPFSSALLRQTIHVEKALSAQFGYPTVVSQTQAIQPDQTLENMQVMFRIAATLLEQDLALSYYHGRHDFPQPVRNFTTQQKQTFHPRGVDPEQDCTECIEGLLQTQVTLAYPRVQVLGFNLAGEIPINWLGPTLGGIGYRFELGIYFPEEMRIALFQDEISIGGFNQPAGEYDYDKDGEAGGPRPTVVASTPFAKWTLGLDYSFGAHVMLNLMWVHGLPDEFGKGDFLSERLVVREAQIVGDPNELNQCVIEEQLGLSDKPCGPQFAREVLRPRLGDYAVIGLDFHFLENRALFRIFALWDLSGYYEETFDQNSQSRQRRYLALLDEGFSAILYPELNYNFGNGLELGLGALLQFGQSFSKFGEPAAGGHLLWTRARYSY